MANYASVTLERRSVTRMFLQAWVPKVQSVGQVCNFLVHQHGFTIPSSAAFSQLGKAFVRRIHAWAKDNSVPVGALRHRREQGGDRPAVA